MANSISNGNINSANSSDLEFYVRSALELGELSPAMATQINRRVNAGNLSDRDRTLLKILHDAIQDGCIQQI